MKSKVTLAVLYEYGHVTCQPAPGAVQLSKRGFEYLEHLCLNSEQSESSFLRLKRFKGLRAIQVRNYVGVLQLPTGEQLEILPKIGRAGQLTDDESDNNKLREEAQNESRQALLNMLRHLRQFRHIQSSEAQLQSNRMPLLEVFIRQFLQSVNQLIKRGLRSEYVQREDNLRFMKGKLLTSQQLKHNLVNQHRFYVQYEEYLPDRPANRLIHAALACVADYTRVNSSQKLCRELSFAFDGIPQSRDVRQDFAAVRIDRGMDYYHQPLAWAKLILEGFSPLSMRGDRKALSLLFPMEAVFEAFVGSVISKQLPQEYHLREQLQSQSLVQFGENKWFRLKPDQVIFKGKDIALVMDTKWKLIDASKNNGSDKFGLSQQDFYQMFAYGHKYLKGEGDLVLIYPKWAKFKRPIDTPFVLSEKLRLWVVPFDVSEKTKDKDRLQLPEQLSVECFDCHDEALLCS